VSVCLLITTVSPTKTAEAIELPLRVWSMDSGGPKKTSGGVGIPPEEGPYFGGEGEHPACTR